MATQDDEREREMRGLFNLTRDPDEGRGGVDAILELKGSAIPESLRGQVIQFELKSATSGHPDISTVRDLGLRHIEKWRRLHWLFGVYGKDATGDRTLLYCLYGSPHMMRDWFDEKADYVAPDFALAAHVPALITDDTLTSVLGSGESFDRADAKRLMKNQYRASDYAEAADLAGGRYSRAAMLALLRARAWYVISRGSTLNNPHIQASYFAGWEKITENHAARLRELVVEALGG